MTFQLPELPYDYGVANILHSLLQKALTNVCKYAEVRAVHIQLSFTPEKACFTTEVNRNGLRLARQL